MRSDPHGSGFDGPDPVAATAAGSGPSASRECGRRDIRTRPRDLARARGTVARRAVPVNRRLDAPSLRHALVDLHEFWLTTKGAELGIKPGLAGSRSSRSADWVAARCCPTPTSTSSCCTTTSTRAVVSQVADQLWYPLWDAHIKLDHSVRTVAAGPAGRGSRPDRGARHARGPPHRRRRRAEPPAHRWRSATVAHRDSFALRRTRRADAFPLGAQRRDRAPRRAGSQERTRRTAGRAVARRAVDRAAHRRDARARARLAGWRAGARAPAPARRAHRTAPRRRPAAGSVAGAGRRRDRCRAAHR